MTKRLLGGSYLLLEDICNNCRIANFFALEDTEMSCNYGRDKRVSLAFR